MDGDIPARVADITAAWLNDVLDERFGTIESLELERFGQGVGILGELARLRLCYARGESGPMTVVAKCASPAPENQGLAIAMGFYVREVNFYRHLAPTLDMSVPEAFHVDASETGVPFVLIIEDIAGATTPDQIAGLTMDEAAAIISTIAPMHARFWGTDELYGLDWLPPMNNPLYKGARELGLARWDDFVDRFGDRIDPAMLAAMGAAMPKYHEFVDHVVSLDTPTLTHTDCRAENYLFGGDGPDDITVVDFQLCTRHWGMWDVSNLLAGSMAPAERRSRERDLIRHYVDEINRHGITDFDLATAERHYRWCLFQQSLSAVVVSDLEGGNDRGAQLLEELFLRPIIAATDNDAASLVAEIP